MSIKKILLFNPKISSLNLGDHIIFESFEKELYFILNGSFIAEISTHLPISTYLSNFSSFDYRFVCGSNLIRGKMNKTFRQWDINLFQISLLKPLILVGVGWWQYGDEPNFYTKLLYKNILSKKYIHSVRDEYTLNQFKKMGINNVVNTGCPSIWGLDENHCKNIPISKSNAVLFTLTDYNPNPIFDRKMIETLINNYKDVYFWPQGANDFSYLNSIYKDIKPFKVLNPNLASLNKLLEENIDYIGTRLHGGIKALQKSKRTIIISIDNRAKEKKKDFNIVTLERENISELNRLINSTFETKISIPNKNINTWKKQFII